MRGTVRRQCHPLHHCATLKNVLFKNNNNSKSVNNLALYQGLKGPYLSGISKGFSYFLTEFLKLNPLFNADFQINEIKGLSEVMYSSKEQKKKKEVMERSLVSCFNLHLEKYLGINVNDGDFYLT